MRTLVGAQPSRDRKGARCSSARHPAPLRSRLGCVCLGFGVLLVPGVLYAQSSLRAGVARADITPTRGRVHDKLYATVLLLTSGDTSLALVSCDLPSFVSTRVAAQAREKFGITHTILSSSGTHSAPATIAEADDKIIAAIGEARKSEFPAQIHVAIGRAYLAFNRRKVAHGRASMWWRNPETLPSHPLDPTVNVIAIRDAEKVRAVLVNFAARATVVGPAAGEVSADYPGALRRDVEAKTPGALCLFVQGASGDISPYREREPGKAPAFEAMERMGGELAAEVIRVLARAKAVPDAAPPLRVAEETIEVADRWQPEKRMQIGIAAGAIGGGLCFVALPGEPFIEHQITFQARSECAMPLLFGASYSGSGVWAGAMPTIRAAAEGGEGAGYATAVAVGAGEMLVDRGVVDIFKLRGLLQDLPDSRF